jgi:hypothetical protein
MVRIQAVGGPTAILEVGGLRLLTDPTFDPPGDYPRPDGPTLVKLAPPALGPDDLGRVDAVLLSHDQHTLTCSSASLPPSKPQSRTISALSLVAKIPKMLLLYCPTMSMYVLG